MFEFYILYGQYLIGFLAGIFLGLLILLIYDHKKDKAFAKQLVEVEREYNAEIVYLQKQLGKWDF
ncbi:MAG: hypothetical protein GYA87_01970 [Christensenellaceae bacterium]|nr:hypothetical protein [Christensenellaceae bacterium]